MYEAKLKDLIKAAEEVFDFDDNAVIAYKMCSSKLLSTVNRELESREDILKLIGGNSVDMLEDNHQNHIDFMQSVFTYRQHELLVKTLPWVYKAYTSKGFLLDYFQVELTSWVQALSDEKNPDLAPIIQVYNKMLTWHEDIGKLSQREDFLKIVPDVLWTDNHQSVLKDLLLGKHKAVLDIILDLYMLPEDTDKVYLELIQPVMYMIGKHWEEGRISVAQEHIAASAVSRVMAHIHMQFDTADHLKGDVVVSTGANEFHQIGARMVSDLMENAGWNVRFLGADIPKDSLGEMLDQINPFIVALSVTMDYNVDKVREMVRYIKSKDRWSGIKIMIGGLAINNDPSLHHQLGADAYPANAIESLAIAETWRLEQ